jgi:hypothetical protein
MSGWMRRRPVTAYVTLAVGLSWAVWLPLLAQTQGWIASGPWPVLHLLGSLGPAAATVVVTAAIAGRAGLAHLGRRVVAWRGRGRAWAFALGVPPALLLVCGSVAAWVGGQSPADLDWAAFWRSEDFAALPLALRPPELAAAVRRPAPRHRPGRRPSGGQPTAPVWARGRAARDADARRPT